MYLVAVIVFVRVCVSAGLVYTIVSSSLLAVLELKLVLD